MGEKERHRLQASHSTCTRHAQDAIPALVDVIVAAVLPARGLSRSGGPVGGQGVLRRHAHFGAGPLQLCHQRPPLLQQRKMNLEPRCQRVQRLRLSLRRLPQQFTLDMLQVSSGFQGPEISALSVALDATGII